jgi:hypothetical protein
MAEAHEGRVPGPPGLWDYAVCYGLYAVLLALCYLCFWTWRTTVEVVAGYLLRRHDAFEAAYLTSILLIALLLFVLIVAGEAYLRRGMEAQRAGARHRVGRRRRLLERFAVLAAPLVVALVVAWPLQEFTFQQALAGSGQPGGAAGGSGGAAVTASGERPLPADTQGRLAPALGPLVLAGVAVAGVVVILMFRRPAKGVNR